VTFKSRLTRLEIQKTASIGYLHNDKVMKEVESVLAEISSIVEKLNNSSK